MWINLTNETCLLHIMAIALEETILPSWRRASPEISFLNSQVLFTPGNFFFYSSNGLGDQKISFLAFQTPGKPGNFFFGLPSADYSEKFIFSASQALFTSENLLFGFPSVWTLKSLCFHFPLSDRSVCFYGQKKTYKRGIEMHAP
ncbi:MAG: hypothetical protein ABJF04_02200 [Reichenbachiella sp.]|uniref:hypothetical protein n=1 Tax=Reichenbachiella sp. TaxID=2184521 RepID=UPI0032668BFF